MALRVSRRGFLKAAAAAGAAAAVTPTARADVNPPGWSGAARVDKIASNCDLCFWRCGVLASVADGKVVRVEGNPAHPQNKGRLCARGNAGTGLLYDPDRLKTPLLRTGARGEGAFKPVSWDEALDFLAGKLREIKEKHGPESVALFPHGIAASFFIPLMRAYGTPNIGMPSFAQCRGPRDVAYKLTFGRPVGSPEPLDLEESRLVVLIGSHLGENVFTSQTTAFSTALARGAKLLTVDPRFSTAASKSDWWLPIRPGSDMALLLAWMNVLVTEKLYDRDYVVRYTSGFEQLEKHVRDLTPEWAAPLTDIPAERIRETARAMGAAKPAVLVHPGRHTTWYGDDVQRGRAMAILTALLGAYGRKGGMFLPTSIKTGGFPTPKFPVAARGRADGAGGRFPLAGEEEGVTNGLVDATLSGKPYPIKAWITYAQNVLGSIPQQARTLEAIMKLDLMVVVDVLPVEQTRYADLVLPEATYLERYDPPMVVATAKEPFISVRMPAIKPLHDSRPGWWIARELARRLDLLAWFPWETPEQHLAKLVEPTGVNLAELVATGAVAFPGKPYLEDRPSDERVFPSPSGKIELWSKQLADLGADPLPRYTAHEQPPTGFVRLLYGRAAVHSFGRTQNNEPLHALMPENAVWLSTATARAWGVADGQRIMLENSDGVRSDPVLAKVTEGIRSDCAFMAHGFGAHAPGLRLANRRGTSDNALISRVSVDPLTGATGMRVNFVRPVRA